MIRRELEKLQTAASQVRRVALTERFVARKKKPALRVQDRPIFVGAIRTSV
jgi:hypothetical protein